MFYRLSATEIDRLIEEDVPFGDLTTTLLGIGDRDAEILFRSRENTVVCCTEEAALVLEQCGASVTFLLKSGTPVNPGETILSAKGTAQSLHSGWKVALNLLEYASGIATRTKETVSRAKEINPGIAVVTTRKSFPGTKKIALKAIMAGGALPHRLGLSETILVFKEHTRFLDSNGSLSQTVGMLKKSSPEHKIIAEADSAVEAMNIAAAGVDIVQVDKLGPEELNDLVKKLKKEFPGIAVSAAGGINRENAAAYAETGVDIIVLSSVYFGKPSDIGVLLIPVQSH
ncbi:MAG: ModD protein [Chlorobiaceae bacterium]|nr:ModD protein [Chlorobiaceae bacterium]